MFPHTLTTHQRILLQRTLATLRATEYWYWQMTADQDTTFTAEQQSPYAQLLAVLLRLEEVRLEMLLLTAGVSRDSGGGQIYPHTSACLALHAETVEAIQLALLSALPPVETVPHCHCADA
jgi:hypothetical protein